MLYRIEIVLRDVRGARIAGYAVHVPGNHHVPTLTGEEDARYTAYEDDGRGNGDAMGEEFDSRVLGKTLEAIGNRIAETGK